MVVTRAGCDSHVVGWTGEFSTQRVYSELEEIVEAAAAGKSYAWSALVARFGGMLFAIARGCGLNEADVAEVHQVTWLRLVEKIDRIEQPDRIGAWLATTAKRESLRIARAKSRFAYDSETLLERAEPDAKEPDDGLISTERAEAVRRAFAMLPPHCRRLLSVLAGDDSPSYKDVSQILSMPIGSIGPTRGRCLDHLRRIMDELGADA